MYKIRTFRMSFIFGIEISILKFCGKYYKFYLFVQDTNDTNYVCMVSRDLGKKRGYCGESGLRRRVCVSFITIF